MSNDACWNCRWRRVRCDNRRPECSKCMLKGMACPGYSPVKPLRWRARIVQQHHSQIISQPRLMSQYTIAGNILPSSRACEILSYLMPRYLCYNANSYCASEADNYKVVPDISPHEAAAQRFAMQPWEPVPEIEMYLCACIVTMHKAVKCLGDTEENQSLLLTYQASAARRLQQMIVDANKPDLIYKVFEAAAMFLCTQIQQSAYGTWRTHLSGAKSLMNHRQYTCLTRSDLAAFVISMADVFATTMAPSKTLLKDTVAEHMQYLQLAERLDAELHDTSFPIPADILKSIIIINIHRAASLESSPSTELYVPSLTATLASLQYFDAEHWADTLPAEYAQQSADWAVFATCYQTASMLYLLQSCSFYTERVLQRANLDRARVITYRTLITSIMKLLDRKGHGGTHYKFVLWPMVICGIEAAARAQQWDLRSLCSALELITIDVGALTMREAAAFLESIWDKCEKKRSQSADCTVIDWDIIFKRAPLFFI